jgi:hypothetical protein
MWELLVGAVLAQMECRTPAEPALTANATMSRELMAAIGCLLIAAVCFVEPGFGRTRILWLIAPVIGAALIIAAGDAWINRHLLARRGVVWIGLMSFPLYLWHWPLLSIVTLSAEQATISELRMLKCSAVAVAFLLAWMTWRWIERPVRRFAEPSKTRPRRTLQVLVLSACVLLATGIIGWRTWDRGRVSDRVDIESDEPLLNDGALATSSGYHRVSRADSVVLLLGDSHANHLVHGLIPEARRHGFGVSNVGLAGCPGVSLSVRLWGSPTSFERCQAVVESTLAHFLPDPAVKVIILSARGALYTTGRDNATTLTDANYVRLPKETRLRVLLDGYASTIRRIEGAGKQVVLALDVPELDFDPAYCVTRLWTATWLGRQCIMDRRSVDDRQRDYRNLIQRLQAEDPRLIVFDPLPLLCDGQWCYAKRNGLLLYRGGNHLSVEGSRLVAGSLALLLFRPDGPAGT